MIGNSAFTARIILQQNEMSSILPSHVVARFSWSYFIAWSSLGLQLVTGSLMVASARIEQNYDTDKN